MSSEPTGAYGPDHDIVDYILGITFEIWEERKTSLIRQYYSPDCVIWGLDGITHGAEAVVYATDKTLAAYPDRLLICEDVIWSHDPDGSVYSSHRLHSTATNEGPTVYGPATGRRIRMTNIADCVIEKGVITREWLVRDLMTLAEQLGADPVEAARHMAEHRTAEHRKWLDTEIERVATAGMPVVAEASDPATETRAFAERVLAALWRSDDREIDACYAPYCVLHRSPLAHVSGRDNIRAHFAALRGAFSALSVSVDHLAVQPHATNQTDIAVRWTVTGTHAADYRGAAPSGHRALLLGVSHWRCLDGRIVADHTVFDELSLLSQLIPV